jgi:transposase
MFDLADRASVKALRKRGLSYSEIGRQLGIHRNTVARLLQEPITKKYHREAGANAATPYAASIREWLVAKVPVERMLELVREDKDNPYKGSRSPFYKGVKAIRETLELAQAERHTRFEGLPGEYAQVDWGEVRNFPFLRQPAATRYYLVVRLKYSRFSVVLWRSSMKLEVLLRALLEAFEAMGGVPWILVFDNMKTVTLGRDDRGRPVWHPVLEKFAQELGFKPEVCEPARPNQKGSAENLVRWVQSSFLQARTFLDDADLCGQNEKWLTRVNGERASQAHGQIPGCVLEEELPHFEPLKHTAGEYGLFALVKPNREGRVHLEGVRYQVPIGYAEQPLVLRLRRSRVDFYDGDRRVASHERPPASAPRRNQVIFEPEQLEPLLEDRPRARVMVYRDYLTGRHPAVADYVARLCGRHRGDENFGPHIMRMYELLRSVGVENLAAACALAGAEKAYGAEYLEGILAVPRQKPVGLELALEGVPEQDRVDRALSQYEAFVLDGGGEEDA